MNFHQNDLAQMRPGPCRKVPPASLGYPKMYHFSGMGESTLESAADFRPADAPGSAKNVQIR